MNTIRQYRPAFVESDEKLQNTEFESWDDLMAIPWVHAFADEPNFYRFSVFRDTLMAEYRGGKEWWVVGFLGAPDESFPAWNQGIYEVILDGKRQEIPGEQVSYSVGDQIGLTDGRVAHRFNA